MLTACMRNYAETTETKEKIGVIMHNYYLNI